MKLSCMMLPRAVTYFKNIFPQVHQTNPLTVPPGGFHAIVGLHSEFESVRLCETEPWRDEDKQVNP